MTRVLAAVLLVVAAAFAVFTIYSSPTNEPDAG